MENTEDLEALLAQIGIEHLQEIETAFAEIERVKEINDRLMRERDDAIKKLKDYMESRPRIESPPSSSANLLYRKYSLDDIKPATRDFSEDLRVGEGEYGVVYRGEIEGTPVAVKIRRENDFILDHQNFQEQELMDDPHIAVDGFTYELEAIKEWFDSGHNTSPMTNLGLDHTNLLPNHSLKSAIQEWKEGNCP